jgi:hypothetical protein
MIECVICGKEFFVKPKSPLTFKEQDGEPAIVVDYLPVYEHIKTHPEAWTPELAQEYEDYKAGKL